MIETNADLGSPQIEVADNGSPTDETLLGRNQMQPLVEIPASRSVIHTSLNEVGMRVTRREGSMKLNDRGGATVGLKN